MSTKTYKASQRGQLVEVPDSSFAPVFSKPQANAYTSETIAGPQAVGTATGNVYTEGKLSWIEVIRVDTFSSFPGLFGVPSVQTIYLSAELVKLSPNANYDATKDTGLSTDKPTTTTPSGSSTTGSDGSMGSSSNSTVSTTPGPGRVPVTASDGKTVYVLVPSPSPSPEPVSTNNKWLTYGLYGVLAIGFITLIVILASSRNTPPAEYISKPPRAK